MSNFFEKQHGLYEGEQIVVMNIKYTWWRYGKDTARARHISVAIQVFHSEPVKLKMVKLNVIYQTDLEPKSISELHCGGV